MNLRRLTEQLLLSSDAAPQLRLADAYIQAFNRLQERFVLPAEHAHLKPIIENFALDTDAFARYIRAIRDGSSGIVRDELHDLYRVVSLRGMQVVRRRRIRRATVLVAEVLSKALKRELTYDEETRLGRMIEQDWGAARLQAMAIARKEFKADRLSAETREQVLKEFWAGVDRSLESGDVPLRALTMDQLKKEFS